MFFLPIVAILVVVWLYLVLVVRKKKFSLFHYQVEPKLAERRYKRLKALLLVAGISFATFWIMVLLQVVLVEIFGQPEEEGPVVFFIAVFSVVLFFIATIGGLVIFLKGRRKTT